MLCHYYVTLRCNDTCEFCANWRLEGIEGFEGSEGIKGLKKDLFKSLKLRRVKTINFTGGEPLLREDLPDLLREAKRWAFSLELTTNGINYLEKAQSLIGLIDRLYFSLDYPVAEEHDRSRGVECFNEVIKALRTAKELGQNPIINFTMTRDSVRWLPEMVELSNKLGVFVHLNPVYDFSGTQGFEPATLEHIRYFAKRQNVLVNFAALEFIKAGGNRVYLPRCRAKETTITVLPDGQFVSPCFFNPGGKQGREDICSSCMRWPYMIPSFAKGIDRYRWLSLWTDWINDCWKPANKLRGFQ